MVDNVGLRGGRHCDEDDHKANAKEVIVGVSVLSSPKKNRSRLSSCVGDGLKPVT